jgi:hypothetical protein
MEMHVLSAKSLPNVAQNTCRRARLGLLEEVKGVLRELGLVGFTEGKAQLIYICTWSDHNINPSPEDCWQRATLKDALEQGMLVFAGSFGQQKGAFVVGRA